MPASQTGRRARRRRNPAFRASSSETSCASFCWRTVPNANSSAATRASETSSTVVTLVSAPALPPHHEPRAEGEAERVLDPVPVEREGQDGGQAERGGERDGTAASHQGAGE